MSERTEKLVKIIMPDLLNYLEMLESGEIIEKRLKQKKSFDKSDKVYKLETTATEQKPNEKKE